MKYFLKFVEINGVNHFATGDQCKLTYKKLTNL